MEKLLKVQWLDARGGDSWIAKDVLLSKKGVTLENVGFGHTKDNGDVVIASQRDMDDGEYKCWWLIPANYIISIDELSIQSTYTIV